MNINIELWAKAGTAAFPDGPAIPFWGFAPAPDGVPQLPGPTIEAKVGDNIRITLHNTLQEPVSMVFPGQDLTPEPVKDGNNIFVSFNKYAPPGGTATYLFRAAHAGTYLYESGSFPERQVQMGLYGVLIVRPADYNPLSVRTRTAYGAGTGTEFDVEKVLVTGEIDQDLHQKINAGLPFDMYKYNPGYFTLNGRAYPDTLDPDGQSSQPYGSAVKISAGKKIILRCANAGFLTHSLHLGQGSFRVVAGDGSPLKSSSFDATYEKTTATIGPGQTYDLIFTPREAGEVCLYDREFRCTVNAGQFPGGIMTSLYVTSGLPPAPGDLTATALSATSVELGWTDNCGGGCGFTIERRRGASGSFTQIADVPPGNTTYTDTGLTGNTSYYYRVRAYNDFGISGYSNIANVRTPVSPPRAPSNLVAGRFARVYVLLAWKDNSDNEDEFIIERRSQNEANFTEIGRTAKNTNWYYDRIVPGTTYYYRVKAQNSGGSSGYSNVARV